MSFGFSVGDIVLLINLTHSLISRVRNAPAQSKEFEGDLVLASRVLDRLRDEWSQFSGRVTSSGTTLNQDQVLQNTIDGIRNGLEVLREAQGEQEREDQELKDTQTRDPSEFSYHENLDAFTGVYLPNRRIRYSGLAEGTSSTITSRDYLIERWRRGVTTNIDNSSSISIGMPGNSHVDENPADEILPAVVRAADNEVALTPPSSQPRNIKFQLPNPMAQETILDDSLLTGTRRPSTPDTRQCLGMAVILLVTGPMFASFAMSMCRVIKESKNIQTSSAILMSVSEPVVFFFALYYISSTIGDTGSYKSFIKFIPIAAFPSSLAGFGYGVYHIPNKHNQQRKLLSS
ncbi:hypothetical protein EDB80DRAFT_773918 [Ilyonectria destructans]|nr:hypothetical protein EDB80DRAFT_773918 [Ilyonectria destructans]